VLTVDASKVAVPSDVPADRYAPFRESGAELAKPGDAGGCGDHDEPGDGEGEVLDPGE